MKARRRTRTLRFITLCFLLSTLIAALFFGGRLFLHKDGVKERSAESVKEKQQVPDVSLSGGERDSEVALSSAQTLRKNIYDRKKRLAAVGVQVASVYVKPLELKVEKADVAKIAALLRLDEENVQHLITTERSFVWLKRNISHAKAEAIKELHLSGVHVVDEEVRYYPQGTTASHVIGFSEGEQGLAGVEAYYDSLLKGGVSAATESMQAAGISPDTYVDAGGAALILSIDLVVQKYLDEQLQKLVEAYEAHSGMALIVHSLTGEILAASYVPTFDSNLFWKSDSFARRDRLMIDPLPLGAFNHLVRMAAEMDSGNIPSSLAEPVEIAKRVIEAKEFKRRVSENVLQNVHPMWKELAPGIYWPALEKSFSWSLGPRDLRAYAEAYGLTGKTGVDLAQAERLDGGPHDLTDAWSKATPMQGLMAFNRLITGGKKVVPHLLQALWYKGDNRLVPASFEQGRVTAENGSGRLFIRLIHALSVRTQKNEVMVETLVQQRSSVRNGALLAEEDTEQPFVYDKEQKADDDKHFTDLVFGAIPSLNPELSMVLVVEGVQKAFDGRFQAQNVVSKILRKSLKEYLAVVSEEDPETKENIDWYKQWRAVHTSQRVQVPEVEGKALVMPDVRQVSLRKALQELQNYNLRIRAHGSGRVVGQHPKPGVSLKDVRECVLELKQDN